MVKPLDLDLFNEVAEAENAAAFRTSELEGRMVLIGRLAAACCSDLQGRLTDEQHRRAFMVLEQIAGMAHKALLPNP